MRHPTARHARQPESTRRDDSSQVHESGQAFTRRAGRAALSQPRSLGGISWVGAELEGDRHVPASGGDDQLMEVAVADDQVPQPAAVDVAALGGQGEQSGVTRSSSYRSLSLLEALCRSGRDRMRTCWPWATAT
jgi:hypothetical protein